MSGTTLEAPATPPAVPPSETPAPVGAPPLVDESMLEDRVPPHLRLSRRVAAVTLTLGIVYLVFSFRPLWHTDVWGHLAYGRQLIATRSLPATEPLMPLAKGVPFIDTAWLSQVIGVLTIGKLGVAGLKGLAALAITACCGLLLQRTLTKTRSLAFALAAMLTFLWLDWTPLAVLRPQLAGLLCFLVLIHRTTTTHPRTFDTWGIPLLIAVWANLHGSFVIGLAWLVAHAAGRAIDVLRRTGSLRGVWRDQRFRRHLLTAELSAAAALLNPYGIALYAEVLTFGNNPNLLALTEWQTLDTRSAYGTAFVVTSAFLAIVYRFTPRRVQAWEVLVLLGLSFAGLGSARFLVWWGPVAAYLGALHAHAAARRWFPWQPTLPESPVTGKWSLVTAGLIVIFLGFSPLGVRLLHKVDPKPQVALSKFTPLGTVAYLRENPPQGLVFNTYEWGDFLQWAGPPGMQVFVNSHAHLVPRDVWLHYLSVVEQSAGWDDVLDRYGVNTVILDKENREGLIKRMKDDAKWKVGYEDRQGAVFLRRKPI